MPTYKLPKEKAPKKSMAGMVTEDFEDEDEALDKALE